MADIMQQLWCCLTCSKTMEAGKLMSRGSAPAGRSLYCPHCGSFEVACADSAIREVPEYFGEIGTRN